MSIEFHPDWRNLENAVRNRKPKRLPLYEHIVDPVVMGRVMDVDMTVPSPGNGAADFRSFHEKQCRFWKEMTYDTVSWEGTVVDILPDHGAIYGGKKGPIQSREDFDRFPWEEIPGRYWKEWEAHLDALREVMPAGMKGVGGVGNGIFEVSEDLVGYEPLCLLSADDPEMVGDLFRKIGDLMLTIWEKMIRRYGDVFCVFRMGDDLGFKTSTLMSPVFIREHVVPQYRRIIEAVHASGKPFLMHSCGKIFPVMDDLIAAGIDAKHSNEDQVAPYEEWIDRYGERIGLLGGVDMNLLCTLTPHGVREEVLERGRRYREKCRGYALGTGNSVPDYVPTGNYLAMVQAAKELRSC